MSEPRGKPDEAPAIFATVEGHRLVSARADGAWKDWGPYLSDRQWGTVREDYSPDGEAWDYLPHDHARSRAYRWGEDAIAGFGERSLRWCLGVALWNGHDPILKERLFGLTNAEGNHGEDVKELYYHLDATPTHSFNRMLYKYPQAAYPYDDLVRTNAKRGPLDDEYELIDTGVLAENRYFDVFVEYAKGSPDDILMRVRVANRGPDAAALHLLPQLWARNTWSWNPDAERPELRATDDRTVAARHPGLPDRVLSVDGAAELLFCDNDSNTQRLFGWTAAGYCKDAIDRHVVGREAGAVNPARTGTKCAAWYRLEIPAGGEQVLRLRFRLADSGGDAFADFDAVFADREAEADAFYAALQERIPDADTRLVQRQAFAGMLWSKQFYEYDVKTWLDGDRSGPPPSPQRRSGRNADWPDFDISAIVSMPDKWEYPWFASWDLALHTAVLALVDPDFAKEQVLLLLREGRMHPSAALPAYEWSFSDANPPLHAWASWRVFESDRTLTGRGDHCFLKRVFNKLTMNFTWWVNRKDENGKNIFQGGFLGLDNISIFNRSGDLPTGGSLSQSDGTAWMAMYALAMLRIAIELALEDSSYQDIAAKFAEHFLVIAGAEGNALWDDADGFFYDTLTLPDGDQIPLRARTMVGLIPVYAVTALNTAEIDRLPEFKARMLEFLARRPDLACLVAVPDKVGMGGNSLMALLRTHRLGRILARVLDEKEFLSPHGLRAVSKTHEATPYRFEWDGKSFDLPYWPAESRSRLFGGNSNWRGPVWMPVNYLFLESLGRFERFYGNGYRVAFPTGSGRQLTLREVAGELANRLVNLYRRGPDGKRPVHGDHELLQNDPHFRDLVLFYEYYHGDNGRGVGASHQCGWSGLVALLIHNLHWNGPQGLPRPPSAP